MSRNKHIVDLLRRRSNVRREVVDDRQAYYAHELPADIASALCQAQPPKWTRRFDTEIESPAAL